MQNIFETGGIIVAQFLYTREYFTVFLINKSKATLFIYEMCLLFQISTENIRTTEDLLGSLPYKMRTK